MLPTADTLCAAVAAARASVDLTQRTRDAFAGAPPPGAVLCVGKSAGPMADGVCRWPAALQVPVVAMVPDGEPLPKHGHAEVLPAPHPFPDARTPALAQRAMGLARVCSPGRPLWLALSGGASAALGAPFPPLTLDRLRDITRALMLQGASIRDLNTVRKHVCDVVGGRLGLAAGGVVAAVAVDIANEDLGLVGSGPACSARETAEHARALLDGVGAADVDLVEPVRHLPPHVHRVVASPSGWRDAVVKALKGAGLEAHAVPRILETPQHAAEALERAQGVHVAVGEVPFAVPPDAPPGGRAAHLALWLAHRRMAASEVPFVLLVEGSDGRDGPTPWRGACVSGTQLAQVEPLQRERALASGASGALLASVGALLPRVASGLNVLDVVVLATGLDAAGGQR